MKGCCTLENKIDYGNWVSVRMMKIWSALAAVFLILSILAFSPVLSNSAYGILLFLRILFTVIAAVMLITTVYMGICRHLFSYTGGRVAAKIFDYVISHLKWDGKGKLLDIGCGSGALTIRAAKKYPEAELTGIDYWGAIWNFGKKQCDNNAKAENVGQRIKFMHGDAASLPFPDGSFDAAVSNFVFHEVATQPDKRLVVKEALRVVKKGGAFAFHDLFLQKSLYGDMDEFVNILKKESVSEIHFAKSCNESFIPGILKVPFMLGKIGIIYGIK